MAENLSIDHAALKEGPEVISDRRYEWRIVVLLSLSFGLVGLDRWVLPPLFPAMMKDLGLGYTDLGNLVGILSVSWGLFAILSGNLSDRIGRRRVLLPAMIAFSVLSGLSGIAAGIASLLAIRALMGAAEGAFTPTSVAATGEASVPSRRGFNQGVMMSLFALLGYGLAPIIATQLLLVLPSWRGVFVLVGLPGLVLAYLVHRNLREPPHLLKSAATREKIAWGSVLAAYNIRVATVAVLCAMSCVFVMGTMVPNYLIDHLKLSPQMMGFIMSAMGWGGFIGEIVVPGVSDIIGRRLASVIAFAGAAVAVWFFIHTDASPVTLFIWLFLVAHFGVGLLALLTGPVATEAVPPTLTSSAVGLVSGLGEIFGGGVGPVLAGIIAARFGIENVFYVPVIGLVLGIVASLFLRETAPRKA